MNTTRQQGFASPWGLRFAPQAQGGKHLLVLYLVSSVPPVSAPEHP